MQTPVTTKDAPELISNVLAAGLVPMVTSSPGMGKSDICKAIAKEKNLKVIDVRLSQCDPVDLNGFPQIDKEKGKASYLPMDMFPVESDTVPKGYNGWLLLMDELTSAPRSVQAAAYKIILDKEVGMHKLHKNVFIVAAGNLLTDGAIVQKISTALQSRMVHLELALNKDHWVEWANDNDIDHRVVAFINFRPELLHKFDPNHDDKTFACPRTWEFLSKIIKPMKDIPIEKAALLTGTVGAGPGTEFRGFLDVYGKIPSIDAILNNPKKVKFNEEEPSHCYAISGMVSRAITEDNIEDLMKFIDRMPAEFKIITLTPAIRKNTKLINHPAVEKWRTETAHTLL